MFKKNDVIQQSIFNKVETMPGYLKKMLLKSWAHTFREKIFTSINEDRFSVLYSDNKASRPNGPINVNISLLVLKELIGLTDEELIGSLHFDTRYQYAMQTENLEQQPASINTLTNFRNRLVDYEIETGIDLLKQEVEDISKMIGNTLNIDGRKIRIDSMMVSSNCKKMSRLELVYSVIYKHIKELSKINEELILDEFKIYLNKEHQKEVIYKINNEQLDSKLTILLKHAYTMYKHGLNNEVIKELESFKLLERLLKEQTSVSEQNELEIKPGKEITPDSLQSSSDPDATYRKKYGSNIGYVANIIEAYTKDDEDNAYSVITSYDVKQNVHSDVKFGEAYLDDLIEKKNNDEKIELTLDGAYFDQDIVDKAKEENIDMYFSDLVGRKPNENKISCTEFEIDENNNIVKCPNNLTPYRTAYKEGVFSAHFKKSDCETCLFKGNCPIKLQKKDNVVRFSEKSYKTEQLRKEMKTNEYKAKRKERAAIEGVPSVLRRKYTVDKLPVRGLVRIKLHFGCKILAYNFRKLQKGLAYMV